MSGRPCLIAGRNFRRRSSSVAARERRREMVIDNGRQAGAFMPEREEYQLIFEHADEAIFIAQDGKLAFVNP